MGNYASCALSTMSKNKAPKVILPSGEVKQLQQPTSAAELMLEIPSYFLVNSKSLQVGKRFTPLNADEDLEMGNVYIMFGMKRVNSLVNAADMGAIFLAAKRSSKKSKGAGKVRVVPACSSGEDSPAREEDAPVEEEEKEERDEMKVMVEELLSEFNHRRSLCRSKKPVLETIVEECVSSR